MRMSLYGFMTLTERELFRLLINNVSGIGPKIALNVLSGISVTALRRWHDARPANSKMLSRFQASGKKPPSGLLSSLRTKIGPGGALEAQSAQQRPQRRRSKSKVTPSLALMALGYKANRKPMKPFAPLPRPFWARLPALKNLVRASLRKGA